MTLRILFVKTEKLSDFLGRGSKLFHSIMVDWKKELLKKLCFVFRREVLCIFRVEFNEHLARGIKLKDICSFIFQDLIKSFLHQRQSWRNSSPNSWYIFSSGVPRIARVKARHALYLIDFSFSLNKLLKAWSYRTLTYFR